MFDFLVSIQILLRVKCFAALITRQHVQGTGVRFSFVSYQIGLQTKHIYTNIAGVGLGIILS